MITCARGCSGCGKPQEATASRCVVIARDQSEEEEEEEEEEKLEEEEEELEEEEGPLLLNLRMFR